MKRELIVSGLLCLTGLFLVLSSYTRVPQLTGATSYYYTAYSSKAICSLNESEIEYRILTQRMVIVWNPVLEILWIPESAVNLIFSVDIQKQTPNSTSLEKTWTWKCTFPNSTQLPVRMMVPLTIYVDNSDFDLPIGETKADMNLDFHVDVINSSGEVEPTYGELFSGTREITLINENPLIAFFTTNNFAIGLVLISVGIGIFIIVALNLAIRKKHASSY